MELKFDLGILPQKQVFNDSLTLLLVNRLNGDELQRRRSCQLQKKRKTTDLYLCAHALNDNKVQDFNAALNISNESYLISVILQFHLLFQSTMFQVSDWTGIYERGGKEIIKIAFSTEKREMLIVYFADSDDKPPSLVG